MLADPKVGGMIEGYLAGLQPSSTPVTWGGLLGGALRGSREAQEREAAKAMRDKEFGLKERGLDIQQQIADIKRQGLLQRMQEGGAGGHLTGIAAQYQSLAKLKDLYGEDSPIYQNAARDMEQQFQLKESLMGQRDKSKTYGKLTADSRRELEAKARGAGLDPIEVVSRVADGENPADVFADYGADYAEAVPEHVSPQKQIGEARMREAQSAELGYFHKKAGKAYGPYTATVYGYSPQLYYDLQTGQNTDQVIEHLASRAMQLEMAALRTKIAGVNITQETLKSMVEKSLSDSKIPRNAITPEIYQGVQDLLTEWAEEGVKKANNVIYGKKEKKLTPKTFSPSQVDQIVKNKKIPRDRVIEILKSQGLEPEGFE